MTAAMGVPAVMVAMVADAALTHALIAGGAGAVMVLSVTGAARLSHNPHRRVRGRLASLQEHATYDASSQVELLRNRSSKIPLPTWLNPGSRSGEEIALTLERAGLDLRVGEYLTIRLVVAALAVALGAMFAAGLGLSGGMTGVLLLGAGAMGAMLPGFLLQRRISTRRQAVERELVEMCDLMASMLQSGFGYLQALNAVAEQVEEPLAGELVRMRDQIRLGAGVDEALAQLNERLASDDFDMVATAILIQRTSGGSLAPILAGVARTIRDRHLFRAEVAALTSRERYSAVVLAGFPLLLTAALVAILPETFGVLFTEPAGRLILGLAMVSDGLGYLLIRRATRLEV